MNPLARRVLLALATGSLVTGTAFAGAVVRTPAHELDRIGDRVAQLDLDDATAADLAGPQGARSRAAAPPAGAATVELAPEDIPRTAAAAVSVPAGGRLPAGTFLVGAARASLAPAPEHFGGETWQREGCTVVEDPGVVVSDVTHALPDPSDLPGGLIDTLDELRSWPASPPDCVYLGGFGLGPLRYAHDVGHGGVWVRSIAISNGERTFVYGVADTVGWFSDYDATICDDCGIRDVREQLSAELGIGIDDIAIGSTHTHAGADTYGGWGGIPDWYRTQIREAAVAAAKQAVANLQPATIDVGEVHLRRNNNERRDTYYSTVDTGATWLQARALPAPRCAEDAAGTPPRGGTAGEGTGTDGGRCDEPEVLASLIAYAAHPTIVSESLLHADWPGAAARHLEALQGGVGVTFEGGLGNASVSTVDPARYGYDAEPWTRGEQRAEATGRAIAEEIAASVAADAIRLGDNGMDAAVQDITHPALLTNAPLVTLASVGLFDRAMLPGMDGTGVPSVYHWSKDGELSTAGEDNDLEPDPAVLRGCTSAGPAIVTTAGAHRIGDLVIAFAPGEIFSNIAEVVKERADRTAVTMVLGQTNDALGYIIQSFEHDLTANLATEYGTQTGEYEEVFAIDRCFGDHVLETLLESTAALGAGR